MEAPVHVTFALACMLHLSAVDWSIWLPNSMPRAGPAALFPCCSAAMANFGQPPALYLMYRSRCSSGTRYITYAYSTIIKGLVELACVCVYEILHLSSSTGSPGANVPTTRSRLPLRTLGASLSTQLCCCSPRQSPLMGAAPWDID
jgi:hypothetical protein